MKRTTKKVEKRTFTLKNAIPRFVSIVSRGANFTPLSELRFADGDARFSDVEINKIVFDKASFSREGVEQYLQENDYEDFEITETEVAYVVPGVADSEFEEVSPIEYGEGVQFHVGKLLVATDTNQAAVEVTDAQVLDFSEDATTEAVETVTVEETTTEEVVQEGDLSVEDLTAHIEDKADEETEPKGAEATSEESTDEFQAPSEEDAGEIQEEVTEDTPVFNDVLFREKAEAALAAFMDALEVAKTESFSLPALEEQPTLYTQEQVDELVAAAVTTATEQFTDKIEETLENTVDETVIVVQNSQAVNTEELSTVSTDSKDERTEKFSQRKNNDLFGLR